MMKLWIFLGGHQKTELVWGHLYIFQGFFSGQLFLGIAKISNIFGVCQMFPIFFIIFFFFWGGGGGGGVNSRCWVQVCNSRKKEYPPPPGYMPIPIVISISI